MKFKVSEDVDAPADLVWARFTDFSAIETDAKRRGADLARVAQWDTPRQGAQWRGQVQVRGRMRPLVSSIQTFAPGERCDILSTIGGVTAAYELTFLTLRPDMTRVQAMLNLSANTLSARLALQTLKLARGRVMTRMQGLMARQGNLAERDYQRAQT